MSLSAGVEMLLIMLAKDRCYDATLQSISDLLNEIYSQALTVTQT